MSLVNNLVLGGLLLGNGASRVLSERFNAVLHCHTSRMRIRWSKDIRALGRTSGAQDIPLCHHHYRRGIDQPPSYENVAVDIVVVGICSIVDVDQKAF